MKLQDLFETSPFSSVTTDMPMYDDMLKANDYLKNYFREEKGITFKVTSMDPAEYIASVSKARDIPVERLRATREASKIAEYAKQMKEESSRKFPILTLDYARFPLEQDQDHEESICHKKECIEHSQQLMLMLT